MPDYSSLSTQIEAMKSEITASLNAGVYTAQDLIFLASALDKLGNMLGVNDIVAATAAQISAINTTASSMVIEETSTSRTLSAATDNSNVIYTTNSSPVTITVPTNVAQAFPVGSAIEIVQGGTGQVTVAASGGVTLVNADNLFKTRAIYSTLGLIKVGTDSWVLSGDVTP